MKCDKRRLQAGIVFGVAFLAMCALFIGSVNAQCPTDSVPAFPGSDTCILDPLSIDKYVTPLVIPPVMNNNGKKDRYDIAVRQFKQQILPSGMPATTVWSYGPASDPTPVTAPDPASQFNYPAYTIETQSYKKVWVRWINDLVDEKGHFLRHLLSVDQTLHWANPVMDCRMGDPRTDCAGDNPERYLGPVPIVTHVHGAHVESHSDGYPEAWWLPHAKNIPAGYATEGSLFDDAKGQKPKNSGYADYEYRQDQPATTLWYHDHSLGMTRLNYMPGQRVSGLSGAEIIPKWTMSGPKRCGTADFPGQLRLRAKPCWNSMCRATRSGTRSVKFRSPSRTAPSHRGGSCSIRTIGPSSKI